MLTICIATLETQTKVYDGKTKVSVQGASILPKTGRFKLVLANGQNSVPEGVYLVVGAVTGNEAFSGKAYLTLTGDALPLTLAQAEGLIEKIRAALRPLAPDAAILRPVGSATK